VILPVDRDDQLAADWMAVDEAFVEIGRNGLWVLYERDPSAALPG
jgi:hypothetical protein